MQSPPYLGQPQTQAQRSPGPDALRPVVYCWRVRAVGAVRVTLHQPIYPFSEPVRWLRLNPSAADLLDLRLDARGDFVRRLGGCSIWGS
ncbi:MAG TPA: hypothetical protein VJ436_08910 [Anaerolineales bacterium]|nr:hypothetical protein [Anaerolineales bacterium]